MTDSQAIIWYFSPIKGDFAIRYGDMFLCAEMQNEYGNSVLTAHVAHNCKRNAEVWWSDCTFASEDTIDRFLSFVSDLTGWEKDRVMIEIRALLKAEMLSENSLVS